MLIGNIATDSGAQLLKKHSGQIKIQRPHATPAAPHVHIFTLHWKIRCTSKLQITSNYNLKTWWRHEVYSVGMICVTYNKNKQ